ncbi:tripartite tricarboxylate transporter substrate binding protein [Achromobacter sp. LC458]|uniref:Bug family tripartite tricarboxylate transporter substrate binding protein n=1 Tax=unclassified Achromobacter TaxID=2626865 RepID=UPI00062A3E41|nr:MULTISPECIES: tripartite tricarboxylate transporter substrate binding protein [unclassified Achromobacter]AYD66518.1 tripartite tricarboxylate transporter substrate binding protein [Achromobacter sp. B7]QYJ20754.1 tripartite tricarboxylate transporter substrate binding protein [Achromobacter sp. ES-001]TRM53135.1 tripartite tricarboxylate transporter substrate binding protein [Achromobacter sp. LC458]
MKVIARVLSGLALVCVAGISAAQGYPDKPIRLIVPFPPGGGTDVLAREAALKVAKNTGWNIVTENRPGSGGNIGVDAVAKSAADGYSLVLGQTSNLAINPTLYAKLPYDPETDLSAIGLIADAPLVLVVPANSPLKSFKDMIAAARAKPEALNYASSGNGTVAHLAAVQLQNAADIKLTHVPYKGAAQASNDLIGGQIDMYLSSVPTLIGHVRNGKMRALAVTSAQRVPDMPDVPTIAESGYPGFEAVTWFGLAAPAGVPQDIVQRLNAEFNKALQAQDLSTKYQEQGARVLTSTPEQFAKLIHDDRIRWGKIVKDSGARVE